MKARRPSVLLGALILTMACHQEPPTDVYMKSQAAALGSGDWEARYDALAHLEVYGAAAARHLIAALGDDSDAISRRAQAALIRHGHTVVPILADALASTNEDSGLFARIAGGRERHRGKSIAGTLWLTIGRGTDPDLRLGELEKLMAHPSTRVRAVAVFTAVTLRSAEYLPILETAAADDDPLVRRCLRQGLVRLLQRGSYSTPVIDAETEAAALDLLAPHLTEAAEDQDLGFLQGDFTYGEILGFDPMEHHRDRFVDMLKTALDSGGLNAVGQENVGGALSRQAEEGQLEAMVTDLLSGALSPEGAQVMPARLVAVSVFPETAFSAVSFGTVIDGLESARRPYRAAARLAATAWARADALEAPELGEQAWPVLESLLDDTESVAPATISASNVTAVWRNRKTLKVFRQAMVDRADTLWARADGASLEETCDLAEVLVNAGDDRYFELFQRAWQQHKSVTLRDEQVLSRCLSMLGWGMRDKKLVELLLPFLAEAKTERHSLVLDTTAAVLVGAFKAQHESFLTDEVFASWMSILEDPTMHPRLRARMTMMTGSPALSGEQEETVRATMMRMLGAPIGDNLRDKVLSRLTYQGDLRVLPDAYGVLTDRDQVHWALSNVISDLRGTAWKIETAELIEILDGMVHRHGPSEEAVTLVPTNNYFNWAVQYQIYPPRRVADELRNRTKQDFGYDAKAWREWLRTST